MALFAQVSGTPTPTNKQLQIYIAAPDGDNDFVLPNRTSRHQILFERTINVAVTAGGTITVDNNLASQIFQTIASSIAQHQSAFDFLGLPRELRDQIYRDALPSYISHQDGSLADAALGLLYVNKQIHHEFSGALFDRTTYNLRFRACQKNWSCVCGSYAWPKQPSAYDKFINEPNAAADIVVHMARTIPIKIATKHVSAINKFQNLKISFDVPRGSGHEGCENIQEIIDVLDNRSSRFMLRSGPEMFKLSIEWTYSTKGRMANKPDSVHCARIGMWEKALKKHSRTAKFIRSNFTRSALECALSTDLEVTRSW